MRAVERLRRRRLARARDRVLGLRLHRREVGNTYVDEDSRYVVSLIVGYSASELECEPGEEIEAAAAAALSLTRDLGSSDTNWYVHDRASGRTVLVCQGQFEERCSERVVL